MYFGELSIDRKWDMFYSMVDNALEKIPHTFVEMSRYEKPWMTPKLKLLINSRYEAYRTKDFTVFNHLKKKVKEEIRKAKGLWLSKLKRAPQGIWKAVQHSSKPSKASDILFQDDTPIRDVADRLNATFAQAFSDSSLEEFSMSPNQRQWNPVCNQSITAFHLAKLKPGKASGNDGLSSRLLKAARDILAPPLTHIFCLSLSSCTVPSRWKTANVVPVPKKNCTSISDFRPISLLPLPSKILEKIVLTSVKDALIDLYGSNQFGFRPGSSTLLAHISIHDHITRQMDLPSSLSVVLITFDMKKAFDSLSHLCLLNSLSEGKLPTSEFRNLD